MTNKDGFTVKCILTDYIESSTNTVLYGMANAPLCLVIQVRYLTEANYILTKI